MPRDNEALLKNLRARLDDPATSEAERATCRTRIADLEARGYGKTPEPEVAQPAATVTPVPGPGFMDMALGHIKDVRVTSSRRGTRVRGTVGGIKMSADIPFKLPF